MTKSRNSLKGIIFALTSGCCWAFSGTLGQFLFTEKNVDPSWLTVVRMISSGMIFLVMTLMSGRSRSSLKRMLTAPGDMLFIVFFAIAGLMLVQYSYMISINNTNAGVATAIQYSGEALVLAVTCAKMKRLPYKSETFGLIIMLAAVFLISTHGRTGGFAFSFSTVIWLILAAVSLMLYTVLPPGIIKKYGSEPVMGAGILIGGTALALVVKVWTIPAGNMDIHGLAAMALIILVGTVLAFSMFMQSTVLIGPVKAGMLSAIETVASPVISYFWLGTRFTVTDYAGFVMMFTMVILLSIPELTKKEHASAHADNSAEPAVSIKYAGSQKRVLLTHKEK
ncbi:MAG: DMT family transporter [Eubacteriales bacterium]|nr:DMT family transporter [Eubacteriales bacterium]